MAPACTPSAILSETLSTSAISPTALESAAAAARRLVVLVVLADSTTRRGSAKKMWVGRIILSVGPPELSSDTLHLAAQPKPWLPPVHGDGGLQQSLHV